MAAFRKSKYPGVYVRHSKGCPAEGEDGPRCRCKPSFRAARRGVGFSPSFKSVDEALSWKADARKAGPAIKARDAEGATFGELATLWWAGVQSGHIAKRRGADGYSDTTLADYKNALFHYLAPRTFACDETEPKPAPSDFENVPAADLGPEVWQAFVDRLSREGKSRSRITTHLAVVRAIYGWASRPSRRLVPNDPTRGIEMPPNREVPRLRVAPAGEAARLLDALGEDDALPYAIAFYTGARLSEIDRMDWADLFLDVRELIIWKSKSRAGTNRRVPIADPLVPRLKRAWLKQGRPTEGRLLGALNITSCGLPKRADKAWGTTPKQRQGEHFQRITLHECRHTYASFLMAARYTLRELMEFMGHSSLQATERYVKMLPQANEERRADRLNAYLEATGG